MRGYVLRGVLGVAILLATLAAPTTILGGPASTAAPVAARSAQRLDATIEAGVRRSFQRDKWNVVIVLTDDQPVNMLGTMPTVRRELAGNGVTYPNAHVPTSLCCPSRSSLLTGLLAPRTNVYDNHGRHGGFRGFRRYGNRTKMFSLPLQEAGYRTGYFGKYLNQYEDAYDGSAEPGWDVWRAVASKTTYRNFSVTRPYSSQDRSRIDRGRRPKRAATVRTSRHDTEEHGRAAAEFIRKTKRKQPLLAMVSVKAPHLPATAAARDLGQTADDSAWWDNPAVGESDISDKPRWVQEATYMGPSHKKNQARVRRQMMETLHGVDRSVGRIIGALKKTKRWNRTLFMFTSDNGWASGEHNLVGKYAPYRAQTDVPLIVRYGNLVRGRNTDQRSVAANVDLTATAMQAGGVFDTNRDGVSMVGAPRTGVPLTGTKRSGRPPYCGWRTSEGLFVRYGSGEEEFYDLRIDPQELENRIEDSSLTGVITGYRLAASRGCSPPPPGFGPSFWRPSWRYPGDDEPEPQPHPGPSPTPTMPLPSIGASPTFSQPTPSATPTPSGTTQTPTPSPSGSSPSASATGTVEPTRSEEPTATG